MIKIKHVRATAKELITINNLPGTVSYLFPYTIENLDGLIEHYQNYIDINKIFFNKTGLQKTNKNG
jgi:hypothetical protein